MTLQATSSKPFKRGTTGWTVDDLDDPRIDRLWQRGRYEIVEGVLTRMAAAYYDSSFPLGRLQTRLQRHLDLLGIGGDFAPEVDLIVDRRRVARVGLIFMTPDDHLRQAEAHARRGRQPRLRFGRLRVPPTLVIESISLGHEDHDRVTKRRWYAEMGVPNYWLLNSYGRTLECLIWEGMAYRTDVSGKGDVELRPALFPGLVLQLGEIWKIATA